MISHAWRPGNRRAGVADDDIVEQPSEALIRRFRLEKDFLPVARNIGIERHDGAVGWINNFVMQLRRGNRLYNRLGAANKPFPALAALRRLVDRFLDNAGGNPG